MIIPKYPNVGRGIRNWATTELQGGAPTSMRSSREGSRLNQIKAKLQQQGVPEENIAFDDFGG